MLHREKPSAILFAKKGYDVWLGNNRGTLYSRNHEEYDPTNAEQKAKYFDFSFFELGKYDVPAQIDYIISSTGNEKVTYIGHSQGTTQMFTALAENFGDVQNKVNLFVALAPITHLFGSHNEFFNALSKSIPLARQVLHFLGIYEFFGDDWH